MIIDADAHVEESEAMFDRLDTEFRPRRPLPVRFATDTVYGKYNAVWLIDGETYPKLMNLSVIFIQAGNSNPTCRTKLPGAYSCKRAINS